MSLLNLFVLQSVKLVLLYSTKLKKVFEFNFVHLRYSLGGYLPSQTTQHTQSVKLDTNTA